MSGIFEIFTDPVFKKAGGDAANHLQTAEQYSFTYYYRQLIAGFLIANKNEKVAQYEKTCTQEVVEGFAKDYSQEGTLNRNGEFFERTNPIPLYLLVLFFKRHESMYSNPAGIVYLLPIIQLIAWVTNLLLFFGAHVPAMMWSLAFFQITSISILTALTLPMAILTGMAWYQALFIPPTPGDKSHIATWEGLLFAGVAVGTFFFPPLLAIISGLFTAVFFYQRYAKISEYHEGLTNLVTEDRSKEVQPPFAPDLITGLGPTDTLQDISTLSRRTRQRYQLGVFYFFAASSWILLRPLSLSTLFATMPLWSGIYVGIIGVIALCALILPCRHQLFPPKQWTNQSVNHSLAATTLAEITRPRPQACQYYQQYLGRNRPLDATRAPDPIPVHAEAAGNSANNHTYE